MISGEKKDEMNYLKQAIFTLTALALINIQASLKGDIDIDIGVGLNWEGIYNCTGPEYVCPKNQILGAVGDLFTTNPATEKVTQLGPITQEVTKKLNLPDKIDGHTLYSYVPKEGELAGTKIYLALRLNEKGRPGSRLSGMHSAELFRLIAGQDPKKDWARMGEFVTKTASVTGTLLPFTFMPNGNISTVESKGSKKETIHSGSKNLNR